MFLRLRGYLNLNNFHPGSQNCVSNSVIVNSNIFLYQQTSWFGYINSMRPVALVYLLAYVLSSLAVNELGSGDGSDAFFCITFPNSGTMLLPDGDGLTSARLASADSPSCSADALRQHELLHWTEMHQFQSVFTCRPKRGACTARPTKSIPTQAQN